MIKINIRASNLYYYYDSKFVFIKISTNMHLNNIFHEFGNFEFEMVLQYQGRCLKCLQ